MSKTTTDTWVQQFTLFWNGNYVRWQELTLNLVKGSTNILVFDHQDSYLSDDPESSVRLQFAPGKEVQGINCDPPFGQLTPLVREEKVITYTFSLDESAVAENFALQFEMPGYVGMPKSPLLPGQVIDVSWLSDFTIWVDGEAKDWSDAHLAIVNRKVCKLTLDYAGSPLIGLKDAVVALESESGGGVPNLIANPKFGDLTPMVYEGSSMSWDIQSTPDAGNAPFKLRLVMPKLFGMLPSPELSGSIIQNAWSDIALRINDDLVSFESAWFYIVGGETVAVMLDFSSSSWTEIPGVALSLELEPGDAGSGLIVDLGFGAPISTNGVTFITWSLSLKSGAANGAFQLHWKIHGVPGVAASPSVPGNILNDIWGEFDFELNGVPTIFNDLFVPVVDGKISTFTVNCERSTVRGLRGANLALEVLPGAGGENLIIDPQKGVPIPIEPDTKSLAWDFLLKPAAGSFPFEMRLSTPGLNRVPKSLVIGGYTYDDVWVKDFTPYVNGLEASWRDIELPLVVGAELALKLDFSRSWMIGLPRSFICLECEHGDVGRRIVSTPPFGTPIEMVKGSESLTWTISVTETIEGDFAFLFKLPFWQGMPHSSLLPGQVLDVDDNLEVKFEGEVRKIKDYVFPCLGATHKITLFPKSGSRFLNKNVKVEWRGDSPESLGVEFTPEGSQQLTEQGISYALDCSRGSKSGKFSLVFSIVEWDLVVAELTMDLAHNKVVARRWSDQSAPGMGQRSYIEVKSYFTEQLLPDFRVWVSHGSNNGYKFTQGNGVLSVDHGMSTPSFLILNQYDGTYP